MFELVFENPCPVNTPVGVAELFKQAGLVGSTVAGVHAEQPAEAFDGVTGVALESTPCFFTDFIDGFIESFDQMEAVDDESGVRAVVLDRFGIGAAHIATGPADALDLGRTQLLFEEPVNGGAAFALANPEDTGAVQVVHNGGESAALQIGNLIDAHCDKPPNPVTGPCPGDDPMKRSDSVEDGIPRIAAAAFCVMIWPKAQIRNSSR